MAKIKIVRINDDKEKYLVKIQRKQPYLLKEFYEWELLEEFYDLSLALIYVREFMQSYNGIIIHILNIQYDFIN